MLTAACVAFAAAFAPQPLSLTATRPTSAPVVMTEAMGRRAALLAVVALPALPALASPTTYVVGSPEQKEAMTMTKRPYDNIGGGGNVWKTNRLTNTNKRGNIKKPMKKK